MFGLAYVRSQAAGIAVISVDGQPFTALPSPDGSTLFVSVMTPGAGRNEIEIFHRSGNVYQRGRTIKLDGFPLGMSVTPDGHTLLVADGDRYAALSVEAAEGDGAVPVATIDAGEKPQAIEVTPSSDSRFAFYSNESASSIGVVRVEPASSPAVPPKLSFVGFIPVDHLPVGLALSPDGRLLYATSEWASGRPHVCAGKGQGTLSVIDVAKAEVDPNAAVTASFASGCDPVRVAVSGDGYVWITVRGDDRVDVYAPKSLVAGTSPAPVAQIKVGTAPVGIALTSDGKFALVANSNRFDRSAAESTLTLVDVNAALAGRPAAVGTIPTGAFPRELRESPQRDTIYLTNFQGQTVEIIPEPFDGYLPHGYN